MGAWFGRFGSVLGVVAAGAAHAGEPPVDLLDPDSADVPRASPPPEPTQPPAPAPAPVRVEAPPAATLTWAPLGDDTANLRPTLTLLAPRLLKCWAADAPAGTVTASWTVNKTRVTEVSVDTHGDLELGGCLRLELASWRFGPDQDGRAEWAFSRTFASRVGPR